MRLGLDALGDHGRARALGLGTDRVEDVRHPDRRTLAYQPQVELDHVGAQQRHQRQRPVVGADVVERDPDACTAQVADRANQGRRLGGERALGDLDDRLDAFGQQARSALDLLGAAGIQGLGLHVDEQRRAATEVMTGRFLEGREAALGVELGEQALLTGGGEQEVGPLEWRAGGPADQRLVADRPAAVTSSTGWKTGLRARAARIARTVRGPGAWCCRPTATAIQVPIGRRRRCFSPRSGARPAVA